MNFNKAQEIAIQSPAKRILCTAGPGTGKTRVMTQRIIRLLKEGVSPYNIMALTFTNKAANELEKRIKEEVSEKVSRKLTVGTFHGVFFRILNQWAESMGYSRLISIYDPDDTNDVMKSIKEELFFNISDNEMAAIKTRKYQDLSDPQNQTERMIISQYETKLFNNCAMDFDQILYLFYMQLLNNPGFKRDIQNQYSHVFVDEYQDTNRIQSQIIQEIDPEHLFVVGDISQAIYSWRGARIEEIIEFPKSKNTDVNHLNISYRCPPEILISAHNLISHNSTGLNGELYSMKSPDPESINTITLQSKEIMLQWLNKHTSPDIDTGILCRTNGLAAEISESLTTAGIDHILLTNEKDLWQNQIVKGLLAYFKVFENPLDRHNLLKVLRLPAREGLTQRIMNEMHLNSLRDGKTLYTVFKETFPEDVFFQFLKYYESNKAESVHDLFFALIDHLSLIEQLQDTPNKLKVLGDFLKKAKEWEENLDIGLLKDIPSFLQWVSFRDIQDQLILSGKKIKVMTAHAAKGLEFDRVIIAGMNEGIFPNSRGDIEEERRLCYVAVTRTKEKAIVLSYLNGKPSKETQVSRFIGEMAI